MTETLNSYNEQLTSIAFQSFEEYRRQIFFEDEILSVPVAPYSVVLQGTRAFKIHQARAL